MAKFVLEKNHSSNDNINNIIQNFKDLKIKQYPSNSFTDFKIDQYSSNFQNLNKYSNRIGFAGNNKAENDSYMDLNDDEFANAEI